MRELPPDGALLFLLEEPLPDSKPGANAFFTRRPARVHLERLVAQDRECFGVSRELAFRTAGRDVYMLAYLGRRVSLHTEILADRVLDSVAIPHPQSDVLARDPYMGVSCGIPNSIACDRVGLSVSLRQPAVAVTATIAGAPVRLDDRQWSGPRRSGLRTLFAGFLQPAGIISRMRVRPDPGSPTTWEANRAVPAVLPPPANVRLRIDYGHGRVVVMQTRVETARGLGIAKALPARRPVTARNRGARYGRRSSRAAPRPVPSPRPIEPFRGIPGRVSHGEEPPDAHHDADLHSRCAAHLEHVGDFPAMHGLRNWRRAGR